MIDGWRRWLALGFGVLCVAGGVGWWALTPDAVGGLCGPVGQYPPISPQERAAYSRVADALDRADLEAARDRLAEVVLETGDRAEAARAYAAKLLVDVAGLAAAAQMVDRYRLLIDAMPSDVAARERVIEYAKRWVAQANRQIDRLAVQAEDFRAHFYRRDIAWGSPLLNVSIRPDAAEAGFAEALSLLRAGEIDALTDDRLASGFRRIALAATFGAAVQQPACAGEAVFLGGPLDVPTLLWLVGSHLKEADLARWYLEEIVALTEERQAHPARRSALSTLAEQYGVSTED
ncbi:MAG TPA: hypothetical protein VF234_07540 [Limnochordia bacterium]